MNLRTAVELQNVLKHTDNEAVKEIMKNALEFVKKA